MFGSVSKNGVEGDGAITLILCGIASVGFFTVKRAWLIVSMIMGILAALVSGYDLLDVQRIAQENDSDYVRVSVGIGLYVTFATAVVIAVTALTLWRRVRRPRV